MAVFTAVEKLTKQVSPRTAPQGRGPEQKRQFEETYNLATKRLSDLERKQEELGRIISELKEQIRMGERMIKSLEP